MENTDKPVLVVGAGSWGTALAIQLARNGAPVLLWGHEPGHLQQLREDRENVAFLPGIPLPDNIEIRDDLLSCLKSVTDILLVVPSHAFGSLLVTMKAGMRTDHRLLWATKGLEPGSGRLLHEVVLEVLGNTIPMALVSGPTFAREVAEGLPTAITVASTNTEFAEDIAQRLHSDTFRAYTSNDMIGVEIGGAVKNVLAIAAGIADGLGFGANARTALITRGLAEIMRLNEVLGGRHDTLMGLAGLGDLVLTCTDNQSRNRRMGLALGQGRSRDDALKEIVQVVEGVQTAREVFQVALRLGVEMPITEQVYHVLYSDVSPKQAVAALLNRQPRPEIS